MISVRIYHICGVLQSSRLSSISLHNETLLLLAASQQLLTEQQARYAAANQQLTDSTTVINGVNSRLPSTINTTVDLSG